MLGPLGLERGVLDESAAERDVQDLDSAAHTEDWQAALERSLDELELEGIAPRLGDAQVLGRRLAVEARVDVPAAAEQDPVAGVERVFEVAADARQHHPDAAGERQRLLEADAAVVAEVVQAQREADNRFPRPAGHADTYIRGLGSKLGDPVGSPHGDADPQERHDAADFARRSGQRGLEPGVPRRVAERRLQLLQLGPQVLPRGLPGDAGHAGRGPYADGLPRERRRDGQRHLTIEDVARDYVHCTQCGACELRCPNTLFTGDFYRFRTRTVDLVKAMRALAVDHGVHQPGWQRWNQLTDERKNEPVLNGTPVSQEHVADWADGLDLPVGGETVLFCDCEAAFYRTSLPRAVAQILQAGGVEFGLMREQWCCGGPAAEMGYADQARRFAEHNVADWRAVGAKRILVLDPHDYILHRGLSGVFRRRVRVRDRARRGARGGTPPRGEARALEADRPS